MICWKCHERLSSLRCASCGALAPPPAQPELFGALGLDRRYHVEAEAIDGAWRKRSKDTHPDRFAAASAVERRMALQWTATLNEARRVLRDPVARAWYLATGKPHPAETGGPKLSPEFLEEIFELRMAADDDPAAVRDTAARLRARLDADLEDLFSRWERGEGDLSPVPERLSRLKYVDNLLRELPA